MYKTKLTSQGTISLPAVLRKKYNLQTGEILALEDNGKIIISKVPDLLTIRKKNKLQAKRKLTKYQNGDGILSHIKEKYGQ